MRGGDGVCALLWVLLALTLPLSLIQVGGQMCSCASPSDGGCVPNQLCDPRGNCDKVNVAYGKPAQISSRYSTQNSVYQSGPACAAVNGRTGFDMKYVEQDDTNCVHTLVSDNQAWWKVDLGQNYTVTDLTIYNREGQNKRLAGIRIYIDNAICKKLPDNTHGYDNVSTIRCDSPLRGQVVMLAKNGTITDSDIWIINFCEVQIWVCRAGRYGGDCSQTCHCHNNATCDNHYGTCPNGCMAGYYGDTCSERCGQCLQSAVCDGSNGHCPAGCAPGYQPPLCKQPCQNKKYGENCREQCGRCQNSAACDVTNGSCQECEGNYALPLCKECQDGYFGEGSCNQQCGQCANNDVCDKATGQCPGGCQPGYQPPMCKQACQNRTYGENCREQCGRCQNSAACNVTNGFCPACEEKFAPPDCKECQGGYFGNGSCQQCGQCADSDVCHKVTGQCPGGCMPGYQPPLCMKECKNGTYGASCREQCGRCQDSAPCDIFNGTCQACEGDFSLPLCAAPVLGEGDTGSNQGGVIGGVIAVVVAVVVVVVIVAVIVVRRRRQSKARSNGSSHGRLQSLGARDTCEQPFTPLPEVSDKGHKKKPRAAVKPLVNTHTNDTETGQHIYANAPATTASTTTTTTAATPARQSAAATARSAETETGETEAGGRGELEEDELVDEAPLYGNLGNVYATLKATKPDLDPVQRHLVDRLALGQLREEFKSIAKTDEEAPTAAGNQKINFKKNRFAQVIPYDRCRVVLTDGYREGTSTDYVNASYISGYGQERKYIAAQGPRDNTVGDLWRLVWQEKITHILMLTNIKEHGRPKCEQYWPEEEGETETYGPVTVTTQHVQQRGDFCVRSLTVTRSDDGESREVTQYHYVSWPDHGVPTAVSLVRFWRYVSRETRHDTAPLLVHCSAGVGRTGTYIGLDLGMAVARSQGRIDVKDIVSKLRQERTLMVQAVDQYVFLYEVLLEAYTARDTVVSLDQFDVIFPQPITASTPNQRIDKEFKALMQMHPLMLDGRHDNATQEANVAKNRSQNTLPLDDHLVYLTEHVAGRNQYINAVFMPTFRDVKGSILTQLPLPSTLIDFWRLVSGNDVSTILSLSSHREESEVKPYCRYWPREASRSLYCAPYTVTMTSRTSVITGLTLYDVTLTKEGVSGGRAVKVLHYEGWWGVVGGDASVFLQLMDTLTTTLTEAPTPRLLIQCSDGAGKSGLFSALYDVINHMTYDREIDVFMTVRNVQNVRPSALTSLAQYRYCYQVAQQRHRDMSVYANT